MKHRTSELTLKEYKANHEAMVVVLRGVISTVHSHHTSAVNALKGVPTFETHEYYAGIRDEAMDILKQLERIDERFT